MSKFTRGEIDGISVKCPVEDCPHAVPESEWTIQETTDHMCPRGHWFRIEGTTELNLIFYRIDPRLTSGRTLV